MMTQKVGKIESGEQVVNSIAMLVTIISFSMLFATLFLSFFLYRLSATQWPPMNLDRIDHLFPAISSILIISSSWFYEVFKKNLDRSPNNARYSFLLCLGLGLAFIISQFLFWNDLKEVGIFASSGIYGSLVYSFTWIHVGHMAMGIFTLLYLLPSVMREDFKKRIRIVNIGKFWHFLAVVWLMMYLLLFVI
ncbi:MAG: hypothetical protein DRQ88_03120 [Epsilonproteobacteria bacterium]|nr:MAG: hypothetical protein DRQ89_13295 [Campylobacterota bacterium]RLA67463.1 MAG: hypothetical protein DRQ88_03120 [Campylobacterota bacterium]